MSERKKVMLEVLESIKEQLEIHRNISEGYSNADNVFSGLVAQSMQATEGVLKTVTVLLEAMLKETP